MTNWTVDRYGDIWAGFILKKPMDINGYRMSAGGPLVRQLREAPCQGNVPREHLGHLVTDEFITLLDRCCAELATGSHADMIPHLADELRRHRDGCSPILRNYLHRLDGCLGAWLNLLTTS